jgi:hypothetical protein
MDFVLQIGLAVFGAVVGAFLSLLLPVIINNQRYKRRSELLGTWKSIYRPDFREDSHWITEDIEIELHFGKLRMRNLNNPSEDYYMVHAEVVQRMYIIGHWFSLHSGANAIGAIILTVNPLGNLMYGYFTGLGDTGERTYCGWVMARKEEDLIKGIELLRRTSLSLSRLNKSLGRGAVSESHMVP